MEKTKKMKQNEAKKQYTSQEKERNGKEKSLINFQCQVFRRRGSSTGHCKLKVILDNQIEPNKMQVFEESGKPEYPGKQKKITEEQRTNKFNSNY